MNNITYTTVDRVLTILHRDLGGIVPLHEVDIIEYIAEAMQYFKIPQTMRQDERLAFLEVKNFRAPVPKHLETVIQIVRDNDFVSGTSTAELIEPLVNKLDPTEGPDPVCVDEYGNLLEGYELAYYRPYFDLQWEYDLWQNLYTYSDRYTPVRLSNNKLYKSLVAQTRDTEQHIYQETYTVVGTKNRCFDFSFESGQVVVAYLQMPVDSETGYPLIPDLENAVRAITNWCKHCIAERLRWSGRGGFDVLSREAEDKWKRYLRQALNELKMPATIDEYQNLLENSLYMLPNRFKYYSLYRDYPKIRTDVRY